AEDGIRAFPVTGVQTCALPISGVAASCPAEFIRFAETLADAARAAIVPHFRTRFQVDAKSDLTPVTVADRNAERAMRERIEAARAQERRVGDTRRERSGRQRRN